MNDTDDKPFPPIAIVGIGCRLPGGVRSPDDFWEVIRDGKDTITEVPPDRWSLDNFYHPDQSKQGKMISRKGGFIDGIDKFDNSFFKISPREATSMDPQQRILLEVVHEAFENAGILPHTLGTSAGVYVAVGMQDYCVQTLSETSLTNPYTLTGVSHSTAANRISYAFDLRGPSYAVDTACASSITAMHLACTGLWNRECETAVVAACNAVILPETSVAFSALGALSEDGKCCPFSNTAKGYVRSEGWGAIILKNMQKAEQDGDHIYALIRGTAIAANGFSNSLTMPSCKAEEYVMKQAYTRFGISLSDIEYVEAHGTGTPVGDPIEAEAIGNTFGSHRETPLKIGSVKGNFGHNECASGITTAIKVALMLDRKMLCPTINFVETNPNIKTDDWKLQVQTQLQELPSSSMGKTTKMSLNSFGFGGAVAHVILEEAPKHVSQGTSSSRSCGWKFGGHKSGDYIIVPLSAKSMEALNDVAEQWCEFKSEKDALHVVSWLSTRRENYGCRLAVICNSDEAFRGQMEQFLETGGGSEVAVGASCQEPKICFVFPGQGQQWGNMGKQMFLKEKVFREAVLQCDKIFQQFSGWSLLYDKNIFVPNRAGNAGISPDFAISDTAVLQPAILFFQIGLLHLLRSWGIFPDAVVGHSLGEVAAAYACGGLSLPEAVCAIYHRSHQQAKLEGVGRMAALRLSLSDAEDLCRKYDELYVAAINAPAGITIAGNTRAISEITLDNPTMAKQLRVGCAFHTPLMNPMETPFREAMEGVVKTEPRSRTVSFYSTVTGQLYEGGFDTEYWWNNIRSTVKFQSAVENIMNGNEIDVFLEVGASATLLSSVNQISKQLNKITSLKLIPAGQREQDDHRILLRALANLYVAGCTIDWKNVTEDCATWVQLPTYPWQHQSFWLETDERRKRRLGQDDRTFRGQGGKISLEMFPFLADHVVQDRLVFPGAGFVEMMTQFVFPETDRRPALSKITFDKLLAWTTSNDDCTEPLSLKCNRQGLNVEITSDKVSYTSANIETSPDSEETLSMEEILSRCKTHITGANIYQKLEALGLQYGPAFQVIIDAAMGDGEIVGFLAPATDSKQRVQVAHVDSCFQLLLFASGVGTSLYLPVSIKYLQMNVASLPVNEELVAYVRVTEVDSVALLGDIIIAASDGRVLLQARDCECHNFTGTSTGVSLDSCLYVTGMQPRHSCLPPTSIASEMFEADYLQTKFPDEMEFIAKAERVIPSLKTVCVLHIRQALTSVKAEQVDKRNIQYFKRLKQISEESCDDGVPIKDTDSVLENIQSNLPELQQEVSLIKLMENNLPQTLCSQSSALFPPTGTNTNGMNPAINRLFYKAGADIIYRAVKVALQRRQVVRILEIEGRLGGMAKYVLPLLKELCAETRVEYILSSSASYSRPSQDQLTEFAFVKHKHCDIEADIVPQGFVSGSIDVVICMTVHSFQDVNKSLENIHKLLSEGGWAFVSEMTNYSCIADVLFGGLQRSWRFNDFRQDSCWLSQEEWKDVFRTSGFKDVVAVSSPQEFFYSIFVSSKDSEDTETNMGKHKASLASFLILTDQDDDTSVPNPLSILCEKLNIPSKIMFLGGNGAKDGCFPNPDTHENNLFCIYNAKGSLYKLTELLQQIQAELHTFKKVFVITTGTKTDAAEAIGLIRSVTNEIQTPVYSIHIEDTQSDSIESLVKLLNDESVTDREMVISKGEVTVPRVIRTKLRGHGELDGRAWKLVLNPHAGSKNTSFEDLDFSILDKQEPLPGQVVVSVKSAALNFKDVMVSLGLLDGLDDEENAHHMGLECSGTIVKIGDGVRSFSIGDEVMGFGEHCFASHTVCDAELLVHKPQKLDWSEAAGICVVFTTAYYSLIKRANLQKDETVLIHSACGGVGLAAIQVARIVGARIICSAGTDEKRSYLRNDLGIDMVTDSRSERFYADVMAWTGGSGVDVVLNSLHGKKLLRGIEALAPGGRFCEIGKRDILQNSSVQMKLLLENKSFLSCQIDRLIKLQKATVHQLLLEVVSLFGENGPLSPVPTSVYPIEEYRRTFTSMGKGNHIGKLVFNIPSGFKPSQLLPSSSIFDANATYIITGGYGGLGLAFARWFCTRGMRYMALVSRKGRQTDAARRTVSYLKRKGTTVFDFALDVSKADDVKTLLNELQDVYNAPVVKGIFHLAGFVADESLSSLTPEMMDHILGAKATSARNLHNLTQHLPLQVFFMTSSSTTTWGHSAQPCYTAANAYLDALAEERRERGLPAISLQLGPVRGAGFLEYNTDTMHTLAIKGCLTLHITEVLQVLGQILQAKDTPAVLCLSNSDWNDTLKFCHKDILKFRHLTVAVKRRRSICVTIALKKHIEERVRKKLGRLLCLEPDGIDLQQPMVNYGVDSLMAVEMVAWSSKEMNLTITQVDILGGITTDAFIQRALLSQT